MIVASFMGAASAPSTARHFDHLHVARDSSCRFARAHRAVRQQQKVKRCRLNGTAGSGMLTARNAAVRS
jgi:hypothetical protein